jgi:hypothetical protein
VLSTGMGDFTPRDCTGFVGLYTGSAVILGGTVLMIFTTGLCSFNTGPSVLLESGVPWLRFGGTIGCASMCSGCVGVSGCGGDKRGGELLLTGVGGLRGEDTPYGVGAGEVGSAGLD